MSALGGNNPPPIAALGLHIDDLFAMVSGCTASPVTTDDQETALDDLLKQVRQASNEADAARTAEKKPHDDAAKAVQAAWKPLLAKCDNAAAAIKAALTPYRTAKQRAKDEAARIAREEADAQVRAAQEQFQKADDLEARFEAEESVKRAAQLNKQANRIDRAPTGLRTSWEAEVTDRKAALYHYIARYPERFEALIQQLADEDARGARGAVPGVLFHECKRAA